MALEYVKGDATHPKGEGMKYIVHICNDIGAWGAGFVVAVSKRWKDPERLYRQWARRERLKLGEIQPILVAIDITVINMVGQKDIHPKNGIPPIRYSAVRKCLSKVAEYQQENGSLATIHMPRIGAGLAGGNWQTIEDIIKDELVNKGIGVTVYDLPRGRRR